MSIDLTNDEQVLAATIWGEARGEPIEGQQAVASVILNRVALARIPPGRRQFGNGSIASCCLQPWQFSSWNETDPNRTKLLALNFAEPDDVLAQCIAIAQTALAGDLADNSNGATFYKVSSLSWPADWGPEIAPLAVIGRQSFYHIP